MLLGEHMHASGCRARAPAYEWMRGADGQPSDEPALEVEAAVAAGDHEATAEAEAETHAAPTPSSHSLSCRSHACEKIWTEEARME